jgi:hypothetical protein
MGVPEAEPISLKEVPMICKPLFAIAALAAIAGSLAFVQPAKDKPAKPVATQPAGQPAGQPQLPPGITPEDMQACMSAATPGDMHKWLAECVGTWKGTNKMWMAPDTEPTVSPCTSVLTAIMDGRYIKDETSGDMPGMGPFTGFGLTGFDNVSGKFQSTWIDNMGTGMMTGTGERSSDGTTLTINYTYNCPIAKGPMVMREVQHRTGKDTMTLEMFGPAPHTNKEYKVMEITLTRSH